MKRSELISHLRTHGCELLREGARHSWWHNPGQNKRSAVPRHTEINDLLAKKICKDLVAYKERREALKYKTLSDVEQVIRDQSK